jgi:hypothetical protein
LIDLIVKVRIHESLFGQGNYELECAFQHLYAPHTVWTSNTTTEKEKIFARFLKNRNLNTKIIQIVRRETDSTQCETFGS